MDRWSRLTAMDREAACDLEEQPAGAESNPACQSLDVGAIEDAGAERDRQRGSAEPVSSFQPASYETDRNCADMCVAESM